MSITELKDKKICITGGTGFVGKHLVPLLLNYGANVTCLARNPQKKLPAEVTRIQGDLGTGHGLSQLVEDQDIVIHMASTLFGNGWQDYLKANTFGMENLAKAIGSNKPKFIYISSLAAAGPCSTAPGKKETDPASPVSAYGWSKLMCENIVFKHFGDEAVILRPPIIYGSGDAALLPVFKGAQKGIAISPGAGRKFLISLIHVRDAAKAIALAAAKSHRGIYHLGDGKIYDMDIFNTAIGKAVGRNNLKILHLPLPVMGFSAALSTIFSSLRHKILGRHDSGHSAAWNLDKYRESRQAGWLADSSKFQSEYGFTADYDLEAGLRETVAGYTAEGKL